MLSQQVVWAKNLSEVLGQKELTAGSWCSAGMRSCTRHGSRDYFHVEVTDFNSEMMEFATWKA